MKTIKEILIITVVASLIGVAYNFTLPEPLSLIREKKQLATVDDSLLFNDNITPKKDTVITADTTVKIVKDTAKIEKEIKKADSLLVSKSESLTESNPDKQKIAEAHSNLGKTVTYEQMKKLIGNPDFIIIDARTPENFAEDKIGNAINIFPYSDNNEVMMKVMELPHDKKIVIYCDGGNCDSSHKLAEIIISFGYQKVFIYIGGWEEWTLMRSKKK